MTKTKKTSAKLQSPGEAKPAAPFDKTAKAMFKPEDPNNAEDISPAPLGEEGNLDEIDLPDPDDDFSFSDYESRSHAIAQARLGRPVRYHTSDGDKTLIRLSDPASLVTSQAGAERERKDFALQVLRQKLTEPFMLSGPHDPHRIDKIAADLFAQHSLLAPAIQHIRSSSQMALRSGASWFRFAPLLVCSPPGIGKTSFARNLAGATGLPTVYIDCSLEQTLASLVSSDAVFTNSRPSTILQDLGRHQIANPIVVFDEVDKLTDVSRNALPNATEGLIGVAQRETAQIYRDSHLQITVDLSHLNLIFLANDLNRIAVPLRDRLKIVQLGLPTPEEIAGIAAREVERRGLDPSLVPVLRKATASGQIRSLRRLHKLLDAAQATRNRPLLN